MWNELLGHFRFLGLPNLFRCGALSLLGAYFVPFLLPSLEIQVRPFFETGLAAGFAREQVANIFMDINTRSEQAFATALADMPVRFPEALFASVKQGFEQRILRLRPAAD